jgi:hypothetical protein
LNPSVNPGGDSEHHHEQNREGNDDANEKDKHDRGAQDAYDHIHASALTILLSD